MFFVQLLRSCVNTEAIVVVSTMLVIVVCSLCVVFLVSLVDGALVVIRAETTKIFQSSTLNNLYLEDRA